MSITARHKKPGAFRKLVHSLETTPPDRRAKILESFKAEDMEFAHHAEKSIFDWEEFLNVPDSVLCELMDGLKHDMRTVALALHHSPAPMLDKFTRNMPAPQQRALQENSELLDKVLKFEQVAAQYRVIAKARELEDGGRFKLKKYIGPYPDN